MDIEVEVKIKLDSKEYKNTTEVLSSLIRRLDSQFSKFTIDNIDYKHKPLERENLFINKEFE